MASEQQDASKDVHVSELKKAFEPEDSEEIVEEKKSEGEGESVPGGIERSDRSFKEESNFFSDLRGYEKRALTELQKKLEAAILGNKLFKVRKTKKSSEKQVENDERVKESEENDESGTNEEKEQEEEPTNEKVKESEIVRHEGEEEKEKGNEIVEEKVSEVDEEISLWGVKLLPSKGEEDTNVLLLKFLRARDFDVDEALDMLRDTLQWRRDFKMDSLMDEDFGGEFESVAYMNGVDQKGHPICYNIHGVFGNEEFYNKILGTEENQDKFLRWRVQLMEKGIKELDFKPGGISSFVQINDLKNSPGPARKELRLVTRRAVSLLQDNYPEFVARNIFINVPFWYYAFIALLSPFLTQRTRSKFVFARPSRVADTLLKYISASEIPVRYGGLKRDDDDEFSIEDVASEVIVRPGSTETIEIDLPEVGTTLIWDLTVLGWDVNYKEEFVPSNEGSYTLIVKKEKRLSSQEGSIRNSFTNTEAGKIVFTVQNGTFTIQNGSFSKKKRVLYRYKIKNNSTS